jgi:hypothetical protein
MKKSKNRVVVNVCTGLKLQRAGQVGKWQSKYIQIKMGEMQRVVVYFATSGNNQTEQLPQSGKRLCADLGFDGTDRFRFHTFFLHLLLQEALKFLFNFELTQATRAFL